MPSQKKKPCGFEALSREQSWKRTIRDESNIPSPNALNGKSKHFGFLYPNYRLSKDNG